MLVEFLKTVVEHSHAVTMAETAGTVGAEGAVVLTSTGIKWVKNINAPIRLLKWGYTVNAVAIVTGGTGLVLKLNSYPSQGATAGKVAIDTLTIADAVNAGSPLGLGTGAYRDPFTASTKSTPSQEVAAAGPIGVDINVQSGQQQFTFSAGQMISIEVTTAVTTSGSVELFVEYELLPVSKPSGYGTTDAGTVSLTEKFTRLAS